MSNYIEYNDKIAFHPGYYIKEIVDESGLTQEDFAKRLDTTPKNLSIIIRGEQSLSREMAMKLSRMLGTSVEYWLNIQNKFDSRIAEFDSDKELIIEREIFKYIDYTYFKQNFNFPDLPRNINEQIKFLREFLNIATLNVLKNRDLAVHFRSSSVTPSISNVITSNTMVQIAINRTLHTDTAKFNKKRFKEAVNYALSLTTAHEEFLPLIKKKFLEAGVVFIVLPHLKNSGINGATKKVGDKIMLMVSDRRAYSDTFWFTLFHEIGHIINGDYGLTFSNEDGADLCAQNMLIPADAYSHFLSNGDYSEAAIRKFAKDINRDPGIVLGRLQNDGKIPYTDILLTKALKHKYKIIID